MLLRALCSRPAVALIRKLIAVLESIERLPLHLYDTPGSLYNLQVSGAGLLIRLCVCPLSDKLNACAPQILTRRLRFRLERAPGETALIDRTGRMLKMEPLATVESLEQYLLKMVRKAERQARLLVPAANGDLLSSRWPSSGMTLSAPRLCL